MMATPESTPGPSVLFNEEQGNSEKVLTNEDRNFFTGTQQLVYDRSRDISRLRLLRDNAFPECPTLFKEEPPVRLQDILMECVDEAIAYYGLENDEFLQRNKHGIALGISKDRSTFRNDVKTYARKAVATVLSVRKELQKKSGKNSKGETLPFSKKAVHHHKVTKGKVKEAFKEDQYLLSDELDQFGNRCNYGSCTVRKVARDLIYSHSQKLGFVFPDVFEKSMPERGIALISSAIECAYMEYLKHGYLKTLQFDPKDFAKCYRRHVRGIQRLQSVHFHRKLFAKVRRRWARENWKDKVSSNVGLNNANTASAEKEDGPPIHLRLDYYLPPGVEMSDSGEE